MKPLELKPAAKAPGLLRRVGLIVQSSIRTSNFNSKAVVLLVDTDN